MRVISAANPHDIREDGGGCQIVQLRLAVRKSAHVLLAPTTAASPSRPPPTLRSLSSPLPPRPSSPSPPLLRYSTLPVPRTSPPLPAPSLPPFGQDDHHRHQHYLRVHLNLHTRLCRFKRSRRCIARQSRLQNEQKLLGVMVVMVVMGGATVVLWGRRQRWW